ncbi:hypothetical protein AAMO2058_000592500 [Amorphochlora amoebiformis]
MMSWPEARRIARSLEGKIDTKLCQYLKAAGSLRVEPSDEETASSPVKALEGEIDTLLQKLGSVTDDMRKLTASGNSSAEEFEMMNRYQSLFHQFSNDFKRTKRTVDNNLKRARLLGSRHDSKNPSLADIRPHEALEKERDGLFSSLGLVDKLIDQGKLTYDELKNQRSLFGRIGGTMAALGRQFPQANDFIKKIRDKQNRDTVILAFVIASCMFFTVMYIMYSG